MDKLLNLFNNNTITLENYIKSLYQITPKLMNRDLYTYRAYKYFKNFNNNGNLLNKYTLINYSNNNNNGNSNNNNNNNLTTSSLPETENDSKIETYCTKPTNKYNEACICYDTMIASLTQSQLIIENILAQNDKLRKDYNSQLQDALSKREIYELTVSQKTIELQNFRSRMCLAGNTHCCYWNTDEACSGILSPIEEPKPHGHAEMEAADNVREYIYSKTECPGLWDSGWYRYPCKVNLKYTKNGVDYLLSNFISGLPGQGITFPDLPVEPTYTALPDFLPKSNCCINIIKDITNIEDVKQSCEQSIINIIENKDPELNKPFSCDKTNYSCSYNPQGEYKSEYDCQINCNSPPDSPSPPDFPLTFNCSGSPDYICSESDTGKGKYETIKECKDYCKQESNDLLLWIIISIIVSIILIILFFGVYYLTKR